MDFSTKGIFLLKFIISGQIPVELGFSALAKQEQAASRSSSVGLTLGFFYHMKMTFEKEMLLLNGVIDLC